MITQVGVESGDNTGGSIWIRIVGRVAQSVPINMEEAFIYYVCIFEVVHDDHGELLK